MATSSETTLLRRPAGQTELELIEVVAEFRGEGA